MPHPRRLPPALAISILAGISMGPANAQEQQSFNALFARGFEIRSVTLVPMDVTARIDDSVKADTAIVTLQNKGSVAVCYVALRNWVLLNKSSLANATLCEVR